MNRFILAIFILLLSGSIFLDSSLKVYGESPAAVSAVKGISDLRAMNSTEGEQKVSLGGEWEFYWKQLLRPEDILQHQSKPVYIRLPGAWGGQKLVEEPLTHFGYGTYRLQIHIPKEDIGKSKALYLNAIGSAYRIWIDGKEQNGLGVVGTQIGQETPELHINFVFFEPKQETMELVIQVSNYSFREGGIISDIIYGDTAAILRLNLKKLFGDGFIVGAFLIMGFYHLIVYGIRRTERSILFVGLFALFIAVRTFILSDYLVDLLLPIHNWEVQTKLEYLTELAGFISLVLLMLQMYPKEVHKSMVRVTFVAVVLYGGYILLTPVRVFTQSLIIQAAILVFILLYYVFFVGIKAALRKREGAYVNLIGLFIIICAICNDTLYYLNMINTIEIADYSVFLFILLQAIIISYRYSLLFNKNQGLTEELVKINVTLEEKVSDRTRELHHKNEELVEVHHTRTKMLANIAHDLGSPIVGIQMNLQLMQEGRIQAGDPNIMRQLLDKMAYMHRLNHDLFELSKLESKKLSFEFEKVGVDDFIQDVFRRFEQDMLRDNRFLQLGRVETMIEGKEGFMLIDKLRIIQVLHNYMENAVKFSDPADTRILLNCYVRQNDLEGYYRKEMCVEVRDYGKGISKEELPYVFNRFYKKSEGNERGSGLGLAISKEIIEQHEGRVGVESDIGKGSLFYFWLPLL